jgi:predicted porin
MRRGHSLMAVDDSGERSMKKSAIALAALSLAVSASAQTVTLFGVVDTTVSGYRNQSQTPFGNTISASQTTLGTGGLATSRIGFRGTEDLGGGLFAGFWLEAGIYSDTGMGYASGGGLQFNRRSTVSVGGPWGEIRLGRDYTPTYWNDTLFDPFGVNGVGTSLIYTASNGTYPVTNLSNSTYSRASNSIGYFLPPKLLGGLYGQFMYAFNGNTSYSPGGATPPGIAAVIADPALATADNDRAGRYIGGRLGYTSGPLDVAVAYGESTLGSNYYVGTTTVINTWNIGGSYDFNVVKAFGEYSNNSQKLNTANNLSNPFGTSLPGFNGVVVGVVIPVFAYDQLRLAYSEVKYNNTNNLNFTNIFPNPKADKFAVGYIYNMSKRTALYATVAYISNKDGAALSVGGPSFYTTLVNGFTPVPSKSVGYDLGLRHSF